MPKFLDEPRWYEPYLETELQAMGAISQFVNDGSIPVFRPYLGGFQEMTPEFNGSILNDVAILNWYAPTVQGDRGKILRAYGNGINDTAPVWGGIDGSTKSTTPILESPQWESFSFDTSGKYTGIYGNQVWTDGEHIYHSYQGQTYVLQKETMKWEKNNWSGVPSNGEDVWTDGKNIFALNGGMLYVFNRGGSSWSSQSNIFINGMETTMSILNGNNVWTDGENIFLTYSGNTLQYSGYNSNGVYFDTYTWSGTTPPSFTGSSIWTDGETIYVTYTISTTQHHYYYNKKENSWTSTNFNGFPNDMPISGSNFWTDGKNIYYYGQRYFSGSSERAMFCLNKTTNSWESIDQGGLSAGSIYNAAGSIWTDGENIYASNDYTHMKLSKLKSAKPVLKNI